MESRQAEEGVRAHKDHAVVGEHDATTTHASCKQHTFKHACLHYQTDRSLNRGHISQAQFRNTMSPVDTEQSIPWYTKNNESFTDHNDLITIKPDTYLFPTLG